MSAHTPGPWKSREFDREQVAIYPPAEHAKRHALIAVVSVGELRPDGEANARLIAAAPDLLAALENVVGEHARVCCLNNPSLRSPIPKCPCVHCYDVAEGRAAIAKARGGK